MARKKSGFSWYDWWPLVIGIAVTPVALRAASVMALSGPDALTLLYPWVQVLKSSLFRVEAGLSDSIAQWVMYLQFPLYGLLLMRLRRKGFMVAMGAVALLHVVGIGAAILLTHWQNPSLRFFG